jgi:hypothetical protein
LLSTPQLKSLIKLIYQSKDNFNKRKLRARSSHKVLSMKKQKITREKFGVVRQKRLSI